MFLAEEGVTMTKVDLIERVCDNVEGITKKQAAEYLESILDLIKDTLKRGETVKISGLGNFVVREKKPRQGRNPQTGEPIVISERRVVNFKMSQLLKAKMNDR